MSYFYTQEHVEPPKRHGKAVEDPSRRATRQSPVRNHPTRDEAIAKQIDAMNANVTDDYVLGKVDKTTPRGNGIRHAGAHKPNQIVFDAPKPNTPPKKRIRTGVTDEELSKIWQEDAKKEQAARAMMDKTNPVEKMYKCEYPMPHAQDANAPRKKQIHVAKSDGENEPVGLKGVGAQCEPPKRAGRRCVEVPEFEPPKLQLKPRQTGRAAESKPKDTWNLGDHVTQPAEDKSYAKITGTDRTLDPAKMEAAGKDPNGRLNKQANQRFWGA